jgi:hypothetical protein
VYFLGFVEAGDAQRSISENNVVPEDDDAWAISTGFIAVAGNVTASQLRVSANTVISQAECLAVGLELGGVLSTFRASLTVASEM